MAQGKPFSLVVHGGGEPTLRWNLLARLHKLGLETAQRLGLEFRGYIATNGLVTEDQARWLATGFGHVGLSCDGPPDVHDAQRPRADGGPTSPAVIRSAAAIKGAGGRLTVRATVTPFSMARQEEVADYLINALGADDLCFEPAFRIAGPQADFSPNDADEFARHFLAAQRTAAALGRELSFPGVRIDELHGPYCDSARHTLRLMPNGTALDCFAVPGAADAARLGVDVGRLERAGGCFALAEESLAARRKRVFSIPPACRDCLNQLHCSRGCPEACVSAKPTAAGGTGGQREFRCRLHRSLTQHWLEEAGRQADRHAGSTITVQATGPSGEEEAAPRPPPGDRSLPRPPWERYGYSLSGGEVWRNIATAVEPTRPVSLYVHVPFCDRRCGFCDCLSRVKRGDAEEGFVRTLLEEIAAWGCLDRIRKAPVTTVHFGGGTPNCLTPSHLARVVAAIGATFLVDGATEVAIESTVGRSGPAELEFLRSLGFTRLHVGIQSFDDGIRSRIGRRHDAREARLAIRNAVDAGWVTSIDLLFGLPGQTTDMLLRSVKETIASRAHGVSLYRFNRSPRNKTFCRRWRASERDADADFAALLAAEALLTEAGYTRNHLSHYALPADRNLYYTHAGRGENLVALGPTADGSVDGWIFRHGDLEAYLRADIAETMGFEGGLQLPSRARAVDSLLAALLCGRAERGSYEERGLVALPEAWAAAGLLRQADEQGTYLLTGAGSWSIDRMVQELGR